MVTEDTPAHGRESMDALTNIDRGRGEKNAALGGPLEHRRPATKACTRAANGRVAACAWRHRRVPSARDSSIWAAMGGEGQADADGTSTKPRGLGGTAGGAACEAAICFFRSIRRNRNCVATRAGGKVIAKAMA